jgi:hypothetical protein
MINGFQLAQKSVIYSLKIPVGIFLWITK